MNVTFAFVNVFMWTVVGCHVLYQQVVMSKDIYHYGNIPCICVQWSVKDSHQPTPTVGSVISKVISGHNRKWSLFCHSKTSHLFCSAMRSSSCLVLSGHEYWNVTSWSIEFPRYWFVTWKVAVRELLISSVVWTASHVATVLVFAVMIHNYSWFCYAVDVPLDESSFP